MVPFENRRRHSSKMAALAAILDLVSMAYWGDWRKVSFEGQRRRSFKMAATVAILDLVSVDYLTNAWVDWSDFCVAYWG
jgi:hypothetical protein